MSLAEPEITSRTALAQIHQSQMPLSELTATELAVRRLDRLSPLDDGDRDMIHQSIGATTHHRVGADLGDDGDGTCRLLTSGWAARVSETAWGSRQILDFLVPGDAIGLSVRPRMDGLYRVVAISRCVTVDAKVLRDQIRASAEDNCPLRRVCMHDERAIAMRLIEHTTRLGCVTSSQAMAHLLLELRGRLDQVGLLAGERFPMPLSQELLHEALGITVTQVYRVLTQLRRDGLIILNPGWAEIPDPARLAAAAGLGPWRR